MSRNSAIGQAERTELKVMPWLETFLVASVDVALAARKEVRAAKRYDLSDLIRDGLANAGIEVRDTPEGQVWDLIAD